LAACTPPSAQLQKTSDGDAGTIISFTDLRGTLKPCGCSPDLRKGGVDRIAHHVLALQKRRSDLLILHAGNLILDDEGVPERQRDQITLRTRTLAASLKVIGVAAATLGEHDMSQGLDWLEKSVASLPMPLVATNVRGAQWARMTKPSLMLRAGGVRVGIIGLIPNGPDVTDYVEATRLTTKELRSKGADVIVALSSLGLRHSKKLMRKNVDVDLLIAAGQDLQALITDEMEPLGRGRVIQSHVQGSHISRTTIKLTPGRAAKMKHSLTELGWDRPSHVAVKALMTAYDGKLKAINLRSAGSLPALTPGQASYVGVEACLECHEETLPFWKADKHPVAWKTLENDGKTFDLSCVHCHTTGYGQAGGSILGALKNLKAVQCEVCHGPGSNHAEDGEAASISRSPTESLCVTCHNPKHSTRFNFKSYRKRLLVPGHGG
jgi:2',3'-cyclic-nucleotide 2'-phosphodiesterase (5'-nucleotidase family)